MKSVLGFLVAIYALSVVGMAVFQRRFLYFPDPRITHPDEAGLSGVEELHLQTDDGETLVAWHHQPNDGHPVILYFHGNAGTLADRAARFQAFASSGYGFLAISYRGYGGSTGTPTQPGLMRDAETAYREARARGYDGDRIVLMGESLGTGVAIALAAAHKAAALVLDSPFSSAVAVAAAHYRLFPVRWLMLDQFRSDLAIGDVHIPVLIIHGDADRVVPISFARQLFELANEPKTFISVAGGEHLVLGSPEVFSRVREWIDTKTVVKGTVTPHHA